MKASAVIRALQEAVDAYGDGDVLLDVSWPGEVYAVEEEETVCAGGIPPDPSPVLLLQAGERVGA